MSGNRGPIEGRVACEGRPASPHQLWILGSAVSSASGILGEAKAANTLYDFIDGFLSPETLHDKN